KGRATLSQSDWSRSEVCPRPCPPRFNAGGDFSLLRTARYLENESARGGGHRAGVATKPGRSASRARSMHLLDRSKLRSRSGRVRYRLAFIPEQQRSGRIDRGNQTATGKMATVA